MIEGEREREREREFEFEFDLLKIIYNRLYQPLTYTTCSLHLHLAI